MPFSVTRKLSQDLGSKIMREAKSGKSRKVIMSVGEYNCNSQMSEGSKSTLLVAFLYSLFVP